MVEFSVLSPWAEFLMPVMKFRYHKIQFPSGSFPTLEANPRQVLTSRQSSCYLAFKWSRQTPLFSAQDWAESSPHLTLHPILSDTHCSVTQDNWFLLNHINKIVSQWSRAELKTTIKPFFSVRIVSNFQSVDSSGDNQPNSNNFPGKARNWHRTVLPSALGFLQEQKWQNIKQFRLKTLILCISTWIL